MEGDPMLREAFLAGTLLATLIYNGDTSAASMTARTLTPDGADTVAISKVAGTVTMAAGGANTGSNLRTVFWPGGSPALTDSRVCATWSARSDHSVQEGTAHHIVATSDRVRAVTVTKNVIYDVHWVFNVHTFDTARPGVFEQIAQFDMVDVMFRPDGSYQPLPWRVCTQMIGATLSFKIWFPAVMNEPAWREGRYVRVATVPAEWLTPGRGGWYVGHLPPALGYARYAGLRVWSLT